MLETYWDISRSFSWWTERQMPWCGCKSQQEVNLLRRDTCWKIDARMEGERWCWSRSSCPDWWILVSLWSPTSLDEKKLWFALEWKTPGWFEQAHKIFDRNGLFVDTINDIMLATVREDDENKCTELAVIFPCKLQCCCLDFISWKVLFDNHIEVKLMEEIYQQFLVNFCPIPASRCLEVHIIDDEANSKWAAVHVVVPQP